MIRFVVFHTGPDTLHVFRPLMEISKKALAVTNPKAHYVVLTDKETAPFLDKDFEVDVRAPSGVPLMRQFVEAQANYEAKATGGLTVLAGTDCVAPRDLRDACPHNVGVTYRVYGRSHINNVLYAHDHDRAAWFLRRALDHMPADPGWYDDQESWYKALGPFDDWEIVDLKGRPEGTRLAKPDGRWIHLLPCRTHNYFVKSTGCLSANAMRAYCLHYKGVKQYMVQSVNYYILGEGDRPLKKRELRARLSRKAGFQKKKHG